MIRPITFSQPIIYIILVSTLLTIPTIVWSEVGIGDSPSLEFTTVSGVKVDKNYLKGKLIVVDFWASWCDPCVTYVPHMKKTYNAYGSQDVVILGVSSDTSKETMLKFVTDQKLNWLQYFDQGGKLGRLWGIPGVPTLFLISPEGTVLWTGNPPQLEWSLAKAMKEYFGKGELLTNLKKKTTQALIDADKALEDADYLRMLEAFSHMASGAVEDREILKISAPLFNKLKMIQDKGREQKLQAAMKANKEDGRAFVTMLAAIDEAMRVQNGPTPGN